MLGSIFQALDMDFSNGLTNDRTENMAVYQKQFFKMAKEKLEIDAIYFLRDTDGIPKIPLIYFAAMDVCEPDTISKLHRLAWNLGDAPLLFIVTPEKLLIYNNYEAPRMENGILDSKAGLFETIELVETLEAQRQLMQYHRLNLETGEFWRENASRFDIKSRVDTTLMDNLRIMRRTLITAIRKRISIKNLGDKQLASIVHALLGRSILIKYLEERKDSDGNTVFPISYFSKFLANKTCYSDLLESKEATYSLFNELAEHFHGDMFPLVSNEYEIINQSDLLELRDFILGTSNLENHQLALWPLYSFNVIPIQLISSIYELFFHLKVDDKKGKSGTYYTPYHLVSMLVDEVLPWEGKYHDKKIIDPSCGSGIFLVEVYRRLVGKWMYSNGVSRIDNEQLETIMEKCIYGVDLNEEAVRIASFSLSLVMCDYLEPRNIWQTLKFPKMMGYNLFCNDFFDNGKFEERKYDIVIGNPPWESSLSSEAKRYIAETKHIIGDNQIAQAFSWKAGELCNEKGSICLLMPSKGFLFNRSPKNIAYRKDFFNAYNVSVVINYSIFRKVLFEHATGPATAVIYSLRNTKSSAPIFYCTPKPTFTVEDRRRFLIEPTDISKIPQDVVENQLIWKIAMWGTPRDLELINKIETLFPSFESLIIRNGMTHAEGFIRGTEQKRKVKCPEYLGWPLIVPKTFKAFHTPKEDHSEVDFIDYYRCTKKKKAAFYAPHLLLKQSPQKGRFLSEVLNYDALFGNSFIGIHGELKLLKYISVILNSKTFVYYSLMTSKRWLVERDELNVDEVLLFPIPNPSNDDISTACTIYDANCSSRRNNETRTEDFVYKLYRLKDYEIEFVENAIAYVYDYFYVKGKSMALTQPKDNTINNYKRVIINILKQTLGISENLMCNFHCGNAPLAVAQIQFDTATNLQKSKKIDELLDHLDSLLVSERSGNVAIKRNVRIYNNNTVYVIKPNQSRYWSYSSACRDADEIYADIMRKWSENNE